MRIRLGLPEGRKGLKQDEKKEVLDAALEASTRAMVPLVKRRIVPTAAEGIKAGIKWKPEPPGDEFFDLAPTVIARGWGDCDDLAPWHAASLRASGADKRARAFVKKTGPNRWHALVRRGDGSIEDPSKAAGMGSGVNGGTIDTYLGEVAWPSMFVGSAQAMNRPRVRMGQAVYPLRVGGYAARVDVPDQSLPWAWTATHAAPNQRQALAGALEGCMLVGGAYGDIATRDALICGATRDLLCGAHPEELIEALEHLGIDGEDAVGFLGGIGRAVSKVAKIAAPVVSVVNPAAGAALGFGGMALGKVAAKPGGEHRLVGMMRNLAIKYRDKGETKKARAVAAIGVAAKRQQKRKRKRKRKRKGHQHRHICFDNVRIW